MAGKRVGPAEIESVLTAHPAVAEVAAVGVPEQIKGEAIYCFWVPVSGAASTPEACEELAQLVADELGRPFRPGLVRPVAALPRTRSAKTLRRAPADGS